MNAGLMKRLERLQRLRLWPKAQVLQPEGGYMPRDYEHALNQWLRRRALSRCSVTESLIQLDVFERLLRGISSHVACCSVV